MLTESDIQSLKHVRQPAKHVLVPELALIYNIHTDNFDVLLGGVAMYRKSAAGLMAEDNPKRIAVDKLALAVIEFMRSLEDQID